MNVWHFIFVDFVEVYFFAVFVVDGMILSVLLCD